jgi:hypothetical protein
MLCLVPLHGCLPACLLGRLMHALALSTQFPFIVDLKYAFQTDGKLYLILEYLSGACRLVPIAVHARETCT